MLDTTTGTWRDLFEGSSASYVPSGHIMYYHSGIYQAAPFDLSRLERTGPATPVLEGTRTLNPIGSFRQFYSFSNTGMLVNVPGGAFIPMRQLSVIQRGGQVEALPFDSAPYRDARVSPDGQRLAVNRIDEGLDTIWLYDLDPVAAERLTMESSVHRPRWAANGDRLVYGSVRTGQLDILSKTRGRVWCGGGHFGGGRR